MNLKNVKIISNPVVLLNLCVMRDEKQTARVLGLPQEKSQDAFCMRPPKTFRS